MYKITKEFHFSAAHHLHNMPEGHPCARFHGHNYIIKVELSSENLDRTGFVKDYGELHQIKTYIDAVLDHQDLNEVLPIEQPSAENIARHLFIQFKIMYPELSAIEVSETPKTNCRYEPGIN